MTDQIDAGDVRVYAVSQLEAEHRDLVGVVGQHLLGRNDAGFQDVLLVVHVVQEAVEGGDPLAQATRQLLPFRRRDDPRNRVEGNQAFGTGLVAVDGESNADAVEQQVCLAALLGHPVGRRLGEPIGEDAEMRAHFAARGLHFVVMRPTQTLSPCCKGQSNAYANFRFPGPRRVARRCRARCGGTRTGERRPGSGRSA